MIKEVQVFNNNSIYVYFLSCIVIFSYQHFSKKQKISLIYATTIAMEIISQYSWKMTAVMLLMSMFILEEYLSDDKVKCELLSNLWYKIIDFVYQILFIDAGIWIIINIIVSGNWLKDYLIEKGITISLFYGVNICILLITIHKLNTLKFEMCDFKTIKGYFDKFDGKKIEWENYELQQRFEIMVELEDKSFFERKKSYNWFSIEFIDYKIKAYRANREMMKRYKVKKSVIQMLKYIWTLIKEMRFFRYIIGKIRRKIEENTWTIKDFFGRLKSKIRGCSTLEMQLIRNIGIEKGYSKCVIRRKIFEFIYTYLFFNGLKDYYENTRNNKRREFKKFILYVYLHSIKLNIYGNEFKAINKLFEQEKVEEWDIDEFYVAILSLTGAPVTPKTTNNQLDLPGMIERTQVEIEHETSVICEASFSYQGCYCAVDILKREYNGWAIYEVKSSTVNEKNMKAVYVADVAYQKYVLEHCGVRITGTYIVSINNNYIYDMEFVRRMV